MIKRISGLYAIADSGFSPSGGHASGGLVALARDFLRGGAKIVQLRMKGVAASDMMPVARAIFELKRDFDFVFILNDAVGIAKELRVDGVHVGENDLPVPEVRRLVGAKMLIGYSSHSLEEAVSAEKAGADYVAFGAIFPTQTKGPGHPVQGLERLREVVAACSAPVVAIGGIARHNIEEVLKTGVASVAMITALALAENVENETRAFNRWF